ncbi:MAG: hypothetical protein AABZ47_11100 [Planctomycetota bacterium]
MKIEFMNYTAMRAITAAALGAWVLMVTAGCQTSSHKSVRMYDYNNDPGRARPASQPGEEVEVEDDGEWHMVAPGEMIVDPK